MQSSNTNLVHRVMEAGRRNGFFFQYLLLFAVLIFCIYRYNIQKIFGFSLYPDEFGYWASAAKWVGYDWSQTASLGSYYSFGYSFVLAPILKLCQDGVFAYRAAVTVNMLMQCASIGLLWGIFKRLYCTFTGCGIDAHREKTHAIFAVGAAVFYPVWGFYTQMTMAEALLTFVYIAICYQFLLFFEKPKMIRLMLLLLSFFYLYFVHMRTVGTVFAGIAVLVIYLCLIPEYRKFMLPCIAAIIVGAGCGIWMKKIVFENVYATADTAYLAVNDYAGQAQRLKTLLSAKGVLGFLISFAGKLYYLGMASFGMFYVTAWHCMKRAYALWKAEKRKPADWFFLFLLLSMLGQVLISSIYTSKAGRLDGIVYGRYNEYLIPLYIGIGVLLLLGNGHLLRHFLISACISAGLFGVVIWNVTHSGAVRMYGFHAAGLSYITADMDVFYAVPEFCKAFLFGLFLTAFMDACLAIAGKYRRNAFMVCPIVLAEIALILCLSQKYTWYFNDIDYQDLKIYEYIKESEEQTSVTYLYGGYLPYIDLIQFAMREKPIAIVKEKDGSGKKKSWEDLAYQLPEEGFFIVDVGSGYIERIEADYQKCMETASFILFHAK